MTTKEIGRRLGALDVIIDASRDRSNSPADLAQLIRTALEDIGIDEIGLEELECSGDDAPASDTPAGE